MNDKESTEAPLGSTESANNGSDENFITSPAPTLQPEVVLGTGENSESFQSTSSPPPNLLPGNGELFDLEMLTAGEEMSLGDNCFPKRKTKKRQQNQEKEEGLNRKLFDDKPPVLPSNFDEERLLDISNDAVPYSDEEDNQPPDLEAFQPVTKKKRRPKKERNRGTSPECNVLHVDKDETENKSYFLKKAVVERIPARATCEQQQVNVKMFEDEVGMTEQGDCHATVLSGCLAYLLRKERILQLLTNAEEIEMIRQGGWLLQKPPRLPPLVQQKVCYAFYVDGSNVMSPKELSNDDLRPWSSSGEIYGLPVMKPNVRRHPVNVVDGRLQAVKGSPRNSDYLLTEYSAWLPRLLRLRKKIFYLSKEGQLCGNVLILYDYTCVGEAPVVLNSPQVANYERDSLREPPQTSNEVEHFENPFEDEIVNGPEGGLFLRVKPTKLKFTNDRKLFLRYLINDPELLDNSNCLNREPPFLPPLITTTGVFVYFVASSFVSNYIYHTTDGLSPWTSIPNSPANQRPAKRVRSLKRAMRQLEDGQFVLMNRSRWEEAECFLVETTTVLARCQRVRKRVIYIQRNGCVIGNACFVYEYLSDGPIPTLIEKNRTTNSQISSESDLLPTSSNLEVENIVDEDELDVVEEEEVIDEVENLTLQNMQVNYGLGINYPEVMGDMVSEEVIVDLISDDTIVNGIDTARFDDDDSLDNNKAPFHNFVRRLETGHVYLTVRDKKLASTNQVVLDWISNSITVGDRGLLNRTKPGHPPLVRNNRAYAFFVSSAAILPHDVNRDDLSPWSHNGDARNPTCYRSKVRKIGVSYDENESKFKICDTDYKDSPFHLVFLYSSNPREPRLRKKVFYLMETEARMVVSHALFIYDYSQNGELPILEGGSKKGSRRITRRPPLEFHDVDNDVSDVSEAEKDSPFASPQATTDRFIFMQLLDMDFWNDRNRQLHYLVNKPSLVEALGCLNSRVPSQPPPTTGKGAFAFFVNRADVFDRNLTMDSLGPWSENYTSASTKRPKSYKVPLAQNREGNLRVWKTTTSQNVDYQLHTYIATLPRCSRLRKKVLYVLKNGQPVGHALIIYWFTDSGEIPEPLVQPNIEDEVLFQRLPGPVKEEVRHLLTKSTVEEVSKEIQLRYGVNVNQKTLAFVRTRALEKLERPTIEYLEWNNGENSNNIVEEGEIEVSHTEVVDDINEENDFSNDRTMSSVPRDFLNPASTVSIRKSQRNAIWRIAKASLGAVSDEETFDLLFRMLFEKDEGRLLQNVNSKFGVDIFPGDEEMMREIVDVTVGDRHGIVEEVVVEEEVDDQQSSNPIIEEVYVEEEVVVDDSHLEE